MNIEFIPSPYFSERTSSVIDTIVIHYISCINLFPGDEEKAFDIKNNIDLFSFPQGKEKIKLSSHYLISRNGDVIKFVDELSKAWHAGISKMPIPTDKRENVNDFSIGIELVGGKWVDFTENQYISLIELIKDIKKRHNIKYIVGHDQISPGRKVDPGKRFNWEKLGNGLLNEAEKDVYNSLIKNNIENLFKIPIAEMDNIKNNDYIMENDISDGLEKKSFINSIIEIIKKMFK